VALTGAPAPILAATAANEQVSVVTAPALDATGANLEAGSQGPPPTRSTRPLTTDEQITAFIRSPAPTLWRNDTPTAIGWTPPGGIEVPE